VLVPGVVPPQVQDPALALVEPHPLPSKVRLPLKPNLKANKKRQLGEEQQQQQRARSPEGVKH